MCARVPVFSSAQNRGLVERLGIETEGQTQTVGHRQSRSTKMNEASSRSHCIATLFLTKILLDEKTGRKFVSRSQMQFVDLSGSERTSKTQVSGRSEIQKSAQGMEGISINLDLWSLGKSVICNVLQNSFNAAQS